MEAKSGKSFVTEMNTDNRWDQESKRETLIYTGKAFDFVLKKDLIENLIDYIQENCCTGKISLL